MLQKVKLCNLTFFSKRPDTRLPQSLAGGQGQWRESLGHLRGSGELKKLINAEKVTSHPHRTWSAVPDALLGMIR